MKSGCSSIDRGGRKAARTSASSAVSSRDQLRIAGGTPDRPRDPVTLPFDPDRANLLVLDNSAEAHGGVMHRADVGPGDGPRSIHSILLGPLPPGGAPIDAHARATFLAGETTSAYAGG